MASTDVTLATFQAEVLDRSHRQVVVVDFWAPWCGPCRVLGPVLERLAAEAGGAWALVKVDTDQDQSLARKYGIQGIPAVKAFRDGRVVAEFVGAQPEPKVREWLKGIVPDEAEDLAKRGVALLEAGRTAEGDALLREALEKDAAQPDALIELAAIAAGLGDKDAARGLLARMRTQDRSSRAAALARVELGLEAPPLAEAQAAVGRDPKDPAARYGLGMALAAAGRWEEALELFLGLVRTDRTWGDDAGRRAMLRVFDVVGARSALADTWRRRLSMELYK